MTSIAACFIVTAPLCLLQTLSEQPVFKQRSIQGLPYQVHNPLDVELELPGGYATSRRAALKAVALAGGLSSVYVLLTRAKVCAPPSLCGPDSSASLSCLPHSMWGFWDPTKCFQYTC